MHHLLVLKICLWSVSVGWLTKGNHGLDLNGWPEWGLQAFLMQMALSAHRLDKI